MANTNSKIFSLLVVGEEPYKIIEKYDSNYKTEPYIKYKYLDAKKYQDNAIKTLTALLDKVDTILVAPQIISGMSSRLAELKKMSSFEYYKNLTEGMYYDENGNAISEENPNAKFNTAKIGRNLCTPFTLKDGSQAFSAMAKDIDWNVTNIRDKMLYETTWELVINDKKPENKDEEAIKEIMKDKTAYLNRFGSKKDYVDYCSSYWTYAYADKNGWQDVDEFGNEHEWIVGFYDKFIKDITDSDNLITIMECSVNNG